MTSGPILTLTLNPAVDVSIDAPQVEDTLKIRCQNPVYDPGGGGVNVARVIQRLGGKAIAHIAAGGGVGRLLVSLLEADGVSCRIHEVAAMTRQNFAVSESSTGKQFRFVLPGAAISALELALLFDRLFSLPVKPAAIVASGSLPPGVPNSIYADIARRCADNAIPFALDTSGPPLLEAMAAPLWLLKVNEREISQALGADWPSLCRALTANGSIDRVVVTRGADGAVLYSRDGVVEAASPAVEALSAVGAGDSFMAAMVLALSRGWPATRALKFSLATGAAAAMTPATDLARADDVERLFTTLMGDS